MSQHRELEEEPSEDVQKLADLIENIQIAMLTTAGTDGRLYSRPMATQQEKFKGKLWFFTQKHSGKVNEIQHDQQINLSYAAPDKNRYVSVAGRAALSSDREKMKELWSPVFKAFFPDGLDDPELALLEVEVESAEYWDAPSSAVVKLVGFVKAVATGKTYQPGENKTLNLNG